MSAVANPAAAAVPARAGPRREEEDSIFSRNNLMMVGQMVAIYCLAKYIMPQILGTVIKTAPSTVEVVTTEGIVTPAVDVKLELLPLWEAGCLLVRSRSCRIGGIETENTDEFTGYAFTIDDFRDYQIRTNFFQCHHLGRN